MKTAAGPMSRLRAEADRLRWPVSFREDLRHDEDALACRSAAAPFVWQIRPCGTWLVFPFPAAMMPRSEQATREAYRVAGKMRPASEHVRNIAATFDARAQWFIWDGASLRPATFEQAAEFCDSIENATPAEAVR